MVYLTLGAGAYGNCLAVGECAAEGTDNIPFYSLAKLSPGTLNPFGVWNRFRGWLWEFGDILALVCIFIFGFTTAANVCTIVAAAVRVGLRGAMAVGWRLYDTHRQTFQDTLREHKTTPVSRN
ncbi:MAG: hypothetical protein GY696_31190 [Gammaproteobacteria bacterium]|nr:hypothetical protein [Gammaproteobacteria bacterium]